jgi:hypothetical protein
MSKVGMIKVGAASHPPAGQTEEPSLEIYRLNFIDSAGNILRERSVSCDNHWQAEAMARICLLSGEPAIDAVEAWDSERVLYRAARF